ncbi:MAG: heavy metal translocating P-type ATPase [Myxococcota bacterium]
MVAAASDKPSSCAHCGLPVPGSTSRDVVFCCLGCEAVYTLLHRQGLDPFYRLRELDADQPTPARISGRSFAEFSHPSFVEDYVKQVAPDRHRVSLYLDGVHCAGCVWLVEQLPNLATGVQSARLDLARSVATIDYDPNAGDLSEIGSQLDRLGYTPHPYRSLAIDNLRRAEEQRTLTRIAVAAAAAGNIMLMAAVLYSGDFHGIEPGYREFFRWTSLLVTLPAVLYSAAPFFRGAWSSFRMRRAHMDLPIAVGLTVGFVSGAINTVRGVGEIYFDSVTALIVLLLVGRYLQRRQQRKASEAAELRHSLTPRHAFRVHDGEVREVPLVAVEPNDVLEVKPSETIPADGTVIRGHTAVDESLLTGEAKPRELEAGDFVHAGSLNLTQAIRLRVHAVGDRSRVGRLMSDVDEAQRDRPALVTRADRIAGIFVLVVLGLAVVGFALGAQTSTHEGLERMVALLVVSCPCALGLATPLAITAALGRAAARGLLIKSGGALEKLDRPQTIFFDKTGTLTHGVFELRSWHGEESLKSTVAGIESHSNHPVAQALSRISDVPRHISAESIRTTIGGGLEARVDGATILIGSVAFVRSHRVDTPTDVAAVIDDLSAKGLTPVLVARDGQVRAVAGLGDSIRADTQEVLDALRQRGHRTCLLSGDHPRTVAQVARTLGFRESEICGGASPEDKKAVIAEAQAAGQSVMMIGDGVNDASALAKADVGIAVHGGAEASLAAADIFSSADGIVPVLNAIRGARKTLRVIRRNHIFSLGYNTVGVSLALAGLIGPLAAAIIMPLSSLTVVISSYRTSSFGE